MIIGYKYKSYTVVKWHDTFFICFANTSVPLGIIILFTSELLFKLNSCIHIDGIDDV